METLVIQFLNYALNIFQLVWAKAPKPSKNFKF